MASIERKAVVFDNGSGFTKAGVAGGDEPQIIFDTVFGVPKQPQSQPELNDCYIGPEATERADVLRLRRPVERGTVTNWEAIEKLWDYTFKQLKLAPEECSVLLAEHVFNPAGNRERTVQLLFENFNSRDAYLAVDGVLALYATGALHGLAVSAGSGHVSCVPVAEGYALRGFSSYFDFGGFTIDTQLSGLLRLPNTPFSTYSALKEACCYVALDYHAELEKPSSLVAQDYQLPDGSVVNVQAERFKATECLFQPYLMGMSCCGIVDLCFQSIMKCEIDMRRTMYSSVLCSGGVSNLPGFEARILKDLQDLAPSSVQVSSLPLPANIKKQYLTWCGGSILASLSSFADVWVTKAEYDETGPTIVRQKCF